MFSRDTFTTAAIDGYLRISSDLVRLDGYPDHKVVIYKPQQQQQQQQQRHRDKQHRVALISGGGDGHSPDTMGFIGHGMLTAAISGNLFASPSTESICAAIKQLRETEQVDILMIIKNYTGDRLNFGLALEITQTESLDQHQHHHHHHGHHHFPPKIDLVIVGDDVAIPRDRSIAGRRGIAGTILVIKIAGGAAEEGKTITEVSHIAQSIANRLVSLSAVFRSCHLPGEDLESTDGIGKNEIALGWGIHNEQGITRIGMERIDRLVHRTLDMLLSKDTDRDFFWRDQKEDSNSHLPIQLVLLVNNLGSMIDNEMMIIMSYVLDELQQRGFIIVRAFCAKFMTGLDQRGFSLTLMRLPEDRPQLEEILRYLDADTTAPAWPNHPMKSTPADRPTLIQLPHTETSASIVSTAFNPLIHSILLNIAHSLIEAADELDELDSQAGDGDCGQTFKQGASPLLIDLQSVSSSGSTSSNSSSSTSRSLLLSSLFDSLRRYTAVMGGTTGALYSILLTGAAKHAAQVEQQIDTGINNAKIAAESLKAGVAVLQRYSGAQLNDRTMLDALCPALDVFIDTLADNLHDEAIHFAFQAALVAAKSGLSSTQHMTARAGRASYVPSDVSKQGVDPGARAIVIMLESIVHTLQDSR